MRLHAQPKLDNLGCAAGLLRDNGRIVPFAEPKLEQWAFPALGIKQGWCEETTRATTPSPDSTRAIRGSGTTPDYVAFLS